MRTPEPSRYANSKARLVLIGVKAPVLALRSRSRVALAAVVLAGVLVGVERFLELGPGYSGVAVLVLSAIWITHKEVERIRVTDRSSKVIWVYVGGAVMAVPFAFAMLLLLALFLVGGAIALVVWFVLVLLRGSSKPVRKGRRGSNSHFNADGSVKIEYESVRIAKEAARKHELDFGGRMNSYRCESGRHFHIGHNKR